MQRLDVHKADLYSLSPEFLERAARLPRAKASSSAILYFPDQNGGSHAYQVRETPVLSPALAAKYPEIRSYSGRSLDNPAERIRFSVSPEGVEGMLVQAGRKSNTYLQKVPGSDNQYLLYQRNGVSQAETDFICYTSSILQKAASGATFKLVEDQALRKYRLAVSATGEYTQYHGGTVAGALAAINATLTRVNEVFETDLGITLELVGNTDQVIFTDPATDPYGSNLNSEVQNTLSSTIGEANYDVGHLFHRGSDAGNAGFIGSVCKDNQKGSAYSAAQSPEGDVFDLDFVAHEIGHQFGANHTWSFESEGTGVQAEPASGTTIMGYAGIVDGNNVQLHGDDYFHYYSIFQIADYVATASCGEVMSIGDRPPVISPTGDFVIPKGTAFVLTGKATDPDPADILTYNWEQIDDGVVTTDNFGPTNATGADFRSLRPDTLPSRYFPRLEEVIQGNLTETNPEVGSAWETVSEVERDLNFALTVRDNASGGGQVASDLVNIRVLNNAGPFQVSSQSAGETYTAGTVQPVTWAVAGTNQGLVNAQLVDIFLSVDGGMTFPIKLLDATPNDGAEDVLLPGVATSTARIMVKAHDNIFFAINSGDFTITESPIVLQFPTLEYSVCQPDDLQIPFTYETFGGFTEEVTFSATGLPGALGLSFTPATATAATNPVLLDITNTDQVASGTYAVTVTATAASMSKQVELQVQLLDGSFNQVQLSAPADGAANTSLNVPLEWVDDPAFSSYEVEIASDPGFTNIVEAADILFTTYKPRSLKQAMTYYWHVKPVNLCGEGTFSPAFSFSTIPINCQSRSAGGLPIPISSVGTPEIESKVNFLDDLPVSDVNVSVDLDHTFLGDLVVSLVSPSGTEVVLISNSCGEASNLDAVFDDDATPFVCGNNPGIGGSVKPLGSLASFNGESAYGQWTLRVSDTAPADGGALNAFSLEICVEGSFRPDADGDGVFDDGDDLCLGTPAGTEVNPSGCPVYRLAADNFTVALDSETCIPSNNGAIEITASVIQDYDITVTGPGVDEQGAFTSQYRLDNLSSGAYNVCITGTDGVKVYEPYCFEVNIQQPEPLEVATALSADGQQAELKLSGANRYLVELNGVLQQVTDQEIALELKGGSNTLSVRTDLPCQGTYREEIYVADKPLLYPNPVQDELTIQTGGGVKDLMVRVFDQNSRLLESRRYAMVSGEVHMNFSTRPPGVYFIWLESINGQGTFKVVKQ